jgi:hypothetical protein
LAACWALTVLAGCGIFSPDEEERPPDKPPISYQIPSLPGYVLQNLTVAYGARDSVAYKDIYDSTYTGSSIDLNDNGNNIDLVYEDEIRHIRSLAVTPGITAYLDLGPSGSWTRLSSDDPSHPEWSIIQISGSSYRVEVVDGTTTYGAIGEGGTFQEFAFTPTPDTASPTDTLWKIVRWKETGKSNPGP